MKVHCINGCELENHEIEFYAGLPADQDLASFGGILCDGCSNGSSQDGMNHGFRGWQQPSQEQIEQFRRSHQ